MDVNAGVTSHTDLLDRSRDRGGGLQVAIGVNVQKMREAIESRVVTVESDMRRVHDEDKAADVQLRGELNALRALLSAGHDQLANSIAALSAAFGEMQGSGPAPGRPHPGRPAARPLPVARRRLRTVAVVVQRACSNSVRL